MLQPWPVADPAWADIQAKEAMEAVMDVIRAIRARRAEMNVPPSKKAHLTLVTNEKDIFAAGTAHLKRLAGCDQVTIQADDLADAAGMVCDVTHAAKAYLPLAELVDLDKERARIAKELDKNRRELDKLEAKLQNPGFVNKAPAQVVEAERDRADKLRALIAKLEESAAALG